MILSTLSHPTYIRTYQLSVSKGSVKFSMSVTAGAANMEKVEGDAGEEVEGEADRKRSKPDEAAELN